MINSIMTWIVSSSYSLVPAFAESIWRGLLLTLVLSTVFSLVRFSASKQHAMWFFILGYVSLFPFISIETGTKQIVAQPDFAMQKSEAMFQVPVPVAATILGIVVFVALLRMGLLFRACRALSLLRRQSTQAPQWLETLLMECTKVTTLRRRIRVRLSTKITAPALAGFFRPVILFPARLIVHLDSEEIRQILLHEIAHLKRHDDWAILFQRLLSIFNFFNPCVLWISRQMNLEREIACDASVIHSSGTPQSYALCLTRLAEFSRPMMSPVPSAATQLSRRVEMLLNRSKKNSVKSVAFAICCIIAISIFALWISHASPLLAVTNEQPVIVAQSSDEIPVATNNDFETALQRMREAQEKMEAAREEMLRAAEAMRKTTPDETDSCEELDCEELNESAHQEMMKELDVHHREMLEHHRLPERPVVAPRPPRPSVEVPQVPPVRTNPELVPAPAPPLPEAPEAPPAPEALPDFENLPHF